jgi:hypothetical protein
MAHVGSRGDCFVERDVIRTARAISCIGGGGAMRMRAAAASVCVASAVRDDLGLDAAQA